MGNFDINVHIGLVPIFLLLVFLRKTVRSSGLGNFTGIIQWLEIELPEGPFVVRSYSEKKF